MSDKLLYLRNEISKHVESPRRQKNTMKLHFEWSMFLTVSFDPQIMRYKRKNEPANFKCNRYNNQQLLINS